MTGAEFSEVDFDLLADYVGGALDGTPDEAVVSALIVGHPAWRRAHAELSDATAAMTAALGAWGAEPEPMPADVVARLDAALAMASGGTEATTAIGNGLVTVGSDAGSTSADAGPVNADGGPVNADAGPVNADAGPVNADGERVRAAAGPGGVEAGGAGSGSGDVGPGGDGVAPVRHLVAVQDGEERSTTARKRARRMKWAAPIGIAAGLVAFLGFGIPQFGAGDAQEATTSAGSAADQAAPQAELFGLPAGPARVLASGIDYTDETLARGAPAMPAAAGGESGAPRPPGTQAAPQPAGSEGEGKVRGMAEPSAGAMIDNDDPLQRLRVQEALLACIAAISEANRAGAITAQSLDYARFEGVPALVVRFTAGNGTWVWAAGADCGTPGSGADRLGAVKVG
ncbi:hypothetical protein [Couchioplanes azureus]|uniref:hypothetical protein n=1 Tax=Couchioplanes caeruleus TaxID=56438 RepID=UPI0016701447|nr:hypothetical protein [Couchioplanes caeruleus]GGQ45651.1 hypothetical protein GCM10010166_12820 [Couchioplanes caeruleus subsp. azureus]